MAAGATSLQSRKFDLVSSASIDVCRFGRNIRSDPWALNLSANKKGNHCDGAKCAACHENEKSFIGRILNLLLSVARVWITHFFVLSRGRICWRPLCYYLFSAFSPSVSRKWHTEPLPRSGKLSSAASDAIFTSPTLLLTQNANAFWILVERTTCLRGVSSGRVGGGIKKHGLFFFRLQPCFACYPLGLEPL